MARKDYYQILGVDKSASKEDIKKAFRSLSKKYHPDKNLGDKTAEEKFKEINEAHSVLSNPEKKSQYDGGNPFEMFNFDFFGRGRNSFGENIIFGRVNRPPGRKRPLRGPTLKCIVDVPLFKFIVGGEVEFSLRYQDVCKKCNGTGKSEWKTCPNCNGDGFITESKQQANMFFQQTTACNACRGIGEIGTGECNNCGRKGYIDKKREVVINIPKGIGDGYVVMKQGAGASGKNGGPEGDLHVKFRMVLPKAEDLTEEQISMLKEL